MADTNTFKLPPKVTLYKSNIKRENPKFYYLQEPETVTGKTIIGPNLGKMPPARNIRLFLKTYPTYRLMYNEPADNMSIAHLTDEKFRALLPRLRETFLSGIRNKALPYWILGSLILRLLLITEHNKLTAKVPQYLLSK